MTLVICAACHRYISGDSNYQGVPEQGICGPECRDDWDGQMFGAQEEEGDVSLWHTILGRETMEHFPCVPKGIDVGMNAIGYFCSSEETPECKIAELCPLRPIYEEYMVLRAVVEAELARATPKAKAESNRRLADAADRTQQAAPGPYTIKAETWEGLT